MSNLMSTLNPSAGSGAATRAAARELGAGDKAGSKDKAGSSFSELMGARPDEARAANGDAKANKLAKADKPERAEKPEKADRPDEIDKSSQHEKDVQRASRDQRHDDEDGDDTGATKSTDATPALPAWLQALREPPPATPTPGPADAALGKANEQAGEVATAVIGAGLGVGAGRTQKLVGSEVETPTLPSLTNGRFGSIGAMATAADADPSLPAPPLPVAGNVDSSLTASQTQALDKALEQIALKTEAAPTVVVAPPERSSSPAITAAPADGSSALSTAQPPALDAFGEPLALDGPDTAVRLGERLRWLSEAGVQEARLQLHPKELGSIDVRIRVEHQTANVWFGADHPAARAALESTLPQLRERLAADGLQLGQAQVGTQAQAQGQGQGGGQGANGEGKAGAPAWGQMINGRGDERVAATPASERLAAAVARHRGLVDRYA